MIVANLSGNYPYDPLHSFNFEPYLKDISGVSLYYGSIPIESLKNDINQNNTDFKILLNFETPNSIFISNFDNEFYLFNAIFHLCPYTCNYLNKKYNTDKFKVMYFPIEDNEYIIPTNRNIPVYYTGHIDINDMSQLILETINRIIGKDKFQQLRDSINIKSVEGYYAKMKLLANVKIAIVHNVLKEMNKFPGYNEHINDILAHEELPWFLPNDLVPQLKSRVFEGGLMGCILLVYKDKYNVIEKYFTENEDFIYYENKDDLDNKIDTILKDYDKYKLIGINIQKKIKENYTSKHFIKYILNEVKK